MNAPKYRVLRISLDYGTWPLWNITPNRPAHEPYWVDPDTLPMSASVIEALKAWATEYEDLWIADDPALGPQFTPGQHHEDFVQRGLDIARSIQRELGSGWQVVYVDDRTGEKITNL